jgi:hypothetical protein
MKLSEFQPGKRLFCLAKGDPGAGKSVQVASFAEEGPQYWIDFDGKIDAVLNFYTKHVPRPDIINNIEFDRFSDFNSAMVKLAEIIDIYPNKYTGGIVLDSLTTGVDNLMAQVQIMKGQEKKADKIKTVGGIQVSDIEDYNAESSALTRLIQVAKFKLPVHFFMIAHVVETQTNVLGGGVIINRQLFTAGKKVAAKIPAYFNEIWHFGTEGSENFGGKKYVVHTNQAGNDFARTSLPLPQKFDVTGADILYPQFAAARDGKSISPFGK